MGGYDIRSAARCGAKIVALCDVDFGYAGKNAEQFPDATRYNDYREVYPVLPSRKLAGLAQFWYGNVGRLDVPPH
jgi:hypothetical protein